jgi:hypothetical protein
MLKSIPLQRFKVTFDGNPLVRKILNTENIASLWRVAEVQDLIRGLNLAISSGKMRVGNVLLRVRFTGCFSPAQE